MNFKLLVITLALTSGFIGGAFAQLDTKGIDTPYSPDPEAKQALIDELEGQGVIIRTQEGSFMIELFPEDAPNHVKRFLENIESDYYVGTVFHRIIEGFMIQGGDPNTKNPDQSMWGQGGPDYQIDNEVNSIKHMRGIVSMARSHDMDSAGSQFFIVHKDSPHLDGEYTAFGRLVPGTYSHDNLDRIASMSTNDRDVPAEPGRTKILETSIFHYGESPHDPPERHDFFIKKINSLGGTLEEYNNTKHDVQFALPYRWAPFHSQTPSDDLNLLLEPTALNHAVQRQIEMGGFEPQILVNVGQRNPNTPTEIVVLDGDIFTIRGGTQAVVLTNHLFEIDGRQAHLLTTIQELETPGETLRFKIIQIHFTNYKENYAVIYVHLEEFFRYEITAFTQVVNNFIMPIDGKLKLASFGEHPAFRAVIEEGKLPPTEDPSKGFTNEIGGCLIATASYGSELAPQVQQLRELRDNTVLQTQSGSTFMMGFNQFYYSFSPVIADYERENPQFKEVVKLAITPLLASLTLLQYVDIDSEHEMLGYGTAIILLNIGMYFIAPVVLITKIRSFYKLQ